MASRYPLGAVRQQREARVEETRRGLASAIGAAAEREQALRAAEQARDAAAISCARLRRHLYDPDERGQLQIAEVARRTEGLRHLEGRLDEA
jgi:hypothetical protein